MADDKRDADQPSLELPSLFRRVQRPSRPRRQLSPTPWGPLPAAALTGVVVGLLAVGLTWLAERGCVALRDPSSCGDPGLLVLLAIVVVIGLAGRALLGALRVSDPGSTSFLATALMAVLAMLFLMGSLADSWMLVVLPVLGAVSFAVARWVTSTHSSSGDRTR